MVRRCCIESCKNSASLRCGMSFHRIPVKEALRQQWLAVIPNSVENIVMPFVCSLHFRPEDYHQGKVWKKLREDAVPSIFAEMATYVLQSAGTELQQADPVSEEIGEVGPQLSDVPMASYILQTPGTELEQAVPMSEEIGGVDSQIVDVPMATYILQTAGTEFEQTDTMPELTEGVGPQLADVPMATYILQTSGTELGQTDPVTEEIGEVGPQLSDVPMATYILQTSGTDLEQTDPVSEVTEGVGPQLADVPMASYILQTSGTELEQAVPMLEETEGVGPQFADIPQFESSSQLENLPLLPLGDELPGDSILPGEPMLSCGSVLPCGSVVIQVTSAPTTQFEFQMPSDQLATFPQPMMEEVKDESSQIQSAAVHPHCEEDALSFYRELVSSLEQSEEDQIIEALVPLSVHPVPLSDAPDPLSDLKEEDEHRPGAHDRPKEELDATEEHKGLGEHKGLVDKLNALVQEVVGAEEDKDGIVELSGAVKEENRMMGVNPVEVIRLVDGKPMRVVLPNVVEQVPTKKENQTMRNITMRCEHALMKLRNIQQTVLRRNKKISVLERQVKRLSCFVCEQFGERLLGELLGGQPHKELQSKKRYLEIIKQKEGVINKLQAEVASLRNGTSDTDGGHNGVVVPCKTVVPRIKIQSANKDEITKKVNRQLLITQHNNRKKSSVDRHKSVHNTSDTRQKLVHKPSNTRQKSSDQGEDILQKSLVGILNTTDSVQESLDPVKQASYNRKKKKVSHRTSVAPQKSVTDKGTLDVRKNLSLPLLETTSDVPQKSLAGNKRKLDVQPKSDAQPTSVEQSTSAVPLIGNKRKSDIRQNPSIFIHPKLDTRQITSMSDIQQITSMSDIQQIKSMSDIQQIKSMSDIQQITSLSDIQQIKSMSDIQQIKSMSDIQQITSMSDIQQITSLSDIQQIKSMSDIQQITSVSDIQQITSMSDIQQSCVGLQRTSDIRQHALVIQIDGMHNTVLQPKLVRLDDNNIEIG